MSGEEKRKEESSVGNNIDVKGELRELAESSLENRMVKVVNHVKGFAYLREKIIQTLQMFSRQGRGIYKELNKCLPIKIYHLRKSESLDILDHLDLSEEIAQNDEIWVVTLDIDTFFSIHERTGRLKPDPVKVARFLIDFFHFITLVDSGEIYWYDDGVYRPHGDVVIKVFLELIYGEEDAVKIANKVLELVKIQTYIEREKLDPKNLIAVENGVIDLRTLEFKPHDPKYLLLQKLPVKYDPNADCPKIKKFMREVMHPEDIPVAEEWIGYCLLKDNPFQKAFCALGDGANGKSTFLMLIRRFLGVENVASISLQMLEKNRFAAAELYGKLANIYADLPDEALRSTGIFKMLVAGDPITAERKFQNPFTFRPYAKLIFSANKLPETRDDTDAFFRRWILINFPNKFEGDKADPHILKKITTPEELSGLLNLALKALKRLLEQGGFSYGKTTEELREQYIRMSDSVGAFCMDCVEISPEDFIPKKELYSKYCEYCRENKLPAVSEQTFHKKIHQYVRVEDYRPRIEGKRVTCWKGIRLKEKEAVNIDEILEKCINRFEKNLPQVKCEICKENIAEYLLPTEIIEKVKVENICRKCVPKIKQLLESPLLGGKNANLR